jgi:hypothetical protein
MIDQYLERNAQLPLGDVLQSRRRGERIDGYGGGRSNVLRQEFNRIDQISFMQRHRSGAATQLGHGVAYLYQRNAGPERQHRWNANLSDIGKNSSYDILIHRAFP